METLFSTEWVHPRDRLDFWHSVACANIVEHDITSSSRADFNAGIKVGSLGDLDLLLFHTSPIEVSHTRKPGAPGADFVVVCQQVGGAMQMQHDSRTVDLGPRDIMVFDPLLPHAGRFLRSFEILCIRVPRREFEARVGKTRSVIARAIKPLTPENHLASSLLATLPSLAGKMSGISADMVANHTLDLLALALSKSGDDGPPRVSDSRNVILSHIRAVIEARLCDAKLDSETVAAEVGISVRYANRLLAEQDTSIARLIQSRRLERCRLALQDPGHAHRSVSEIAYGWGFSDMTHFGRRFKLAYGVPPNEYRQLAKRA